MLTIGKKMRELRRRKDWTLADLAKHSGVVLSSLSRIETGRMTGTLESHIRIAKGLGVRLAELYADVDPAADSVEYHPGKEEEARSVMTAKGTTLKLLTSNSLRKKILPALVILPPGKSTPPEHASPGTEKFLYLLKGKVSVTVGKQAFIAVSGDSLYFQASLTHALKNTNTAPALILSVTSPAWL